MSETQYVTDYKKIGMVAIGCGVGLGILFFILGGQNISFPTLSIPENQPSQQLTEKTDQIKSEYQKYLELGISKDDILDFQMMSCAIFDTPEMLSTDTKYTSIIEQKKIECNV